MHPRQPIDLNDISPDTIHCFNAITQDYTLYPSNEFFTDSFDVETYISRIQNRKIGGNRMHQSLYIHLPLCSTLCRYCNANQLEIESEALLDRYVDYLLKEIKLLGKLSRNPPKVEQIHIGGGTPALLDQLQFNKLMDEIRKNFNLINDGFFRITIDPLLSSNRGIKLFQDMNINYLTIGVQDFNLHTQQTAHAHQSEIENEIKTLDTIETAQQAGFNTIRIELIYGSPKQGIKKFDHMLGKIIDAKPNLINLKNHNPQSKTSLRSAGNNKKTPVGDKFEARLHAIDRLLNENYIHIGMNLFARQDNQLVTAKQQGRLYYDLQGYSLYPDSDYIALGMSAIGKAGPILFQNHQDLSHYYAKLDNHKLPIMHGLELSLDDILRRSVIHALICYSVVSFESVETFFSISFKHYFAQEISELSAHQNAGLLIINDAEIVITTKGQLFIGGICRIFDQYSHAS